MARSTYIQFGTGANAASDVCEFGTPATGSPVYTANIATLQGNTAWVTGWAAETVASNRPFLEDMNAWCIVHAYFTNHLLIYGIAQYDSGTTYPQYGIVNYNGGLWQSLVNSNIGNTPAAGSNWSVMPFFIKVSETQTSGTNGATSLSATATWLTVVLTTKDSDTAAIGTLASNQLTLPAGTYECDISVPIYRTGSSQIRLQNITASTTLILGTSETTVDAPNEPQDRSFIKGQFTLASSSVVAIQVNVSANTNGVIGLASSIGTEVYTIAIFKKIA